MLKQYFAAIFFFFCGSIFSQSPDAELIFQKTDISVNNGKLIRTHLYEIKINNRDGDKYTHIAIPYSKMNKVSKLEAFLRDNKGNVIRKLVKGDITDRSAVASGSFYQDFFLKEFSLRHNLYPYVMHYSYQEEEEAFFNIENWIPVLDKDIPTRNAIVNLEIPADYDIAFSSRYLKDPVKEIIGSSIRYSWNTSFSGIPKDEKFSPAPRIMVPSLTIVPLVFKYDIAGSQKTWRSFGEWQYELIEKLNDLPSQEAAIVSSLVKSLNDVKEKVRRIYHYLQDQTRYINVTIETGGLKPYPASYVAQNKFGDCKALTFYMKVLLEAAGIKSHYSLVHAGTPIEDTDKTLPSQQFNHVILCVPVIGDTIWLDCTSDLAFNYLGTFTQNRDVLIIENDNSHFTRTPSLSSAEVMETRNAVFRYNSQEKVTVSATNEYRGVNYETLFYLQHSVSEPQRSQYIRNNYIENDFNASDFKISVENRDSAVIRLTYSADASGIYNVYGNELLLKILPFDIIDFEQPGKRELPVQLDFPISYRDTLEYEIPQDYILSGIFQNNSITGKYGTYKIDLVVLENRLMVYKNFVLFTGNIPLTEYGDFYNFVSGVRKIENSLKVLFKHK